MKFRKLAFGIALGSVVFGGAALASGNAEAPKEQDWSFQGVFGTYDRAAQQRGFQVYREVCASCHALEYIAFRNLTEIGFTEDEVKAIAAEYEVPAAPDEYGDVGTRPALQSDYWPSPFPNENAARFSNNGALPPDLSLIVKARAHGSDYVYSILTGYEDRPADFELGDGLSYNPYFPNRQIAMALPLFEDAVEYADGTAATEDQMARDVTVFLSWASEPELEARHKLGFKVMLFLAFLTVLVYFSNKKVWADIKGKKSDG